MNTEHQGGRDLNQTRTIRWDSKQGAHEADVDVRTFHAIRIQAEEQALSISQIARAMHAAGQLQPTRTTAVPLSGTVAPPPGGKPRVFMECTKKEKELWVWAAQNMETSDRLEDFMRAALNEKAARIVSDLIKRGKPVPQNIAEMIAALR